MGALARAAGWLGRRTLLFLLLVAAILAWRSSRDAIEGFGRLRETATALAAGDDGLARAAAAATRQGDADAATFHQLGRDGLDRRLAAAEAERAPLAGACGSDLGALVGGGAAGVVENRRRCFRAALLAREIATLAALRDTLDTRRPGEPVADAIRRHEAAMRAAIATERAVAARLGALERDYTPDLLQRAPFAAERARAAAAERDFRAARDARDRLLATQRDVAAAATRAAATVGEALAAYRTETAARGRALSANAVQRGRDWATRNDLAGTMATAGLVLLGILLSPLLVRVLCYYLLAPIVMRRPSIRLSVPGGAAAPMPPTERSAPSVAVRLGEGEELLVRQDYLQTTSLTGAKRTRWLLDPRHPVTSIATGLTFLTRIRGAGEVTTVSAVRDPFAEVAMLDLPEGAACVLQPRALAAVVQPVARPLRVTSHWRLGSVNAWATLQLRYLVFHGPARLVVKGGRGIRAERAERGRIFGQDQLVGFSADLAYSVTRAETFWPYLLGREPLFKDRVEAGGGVLIVEEAPLAAFRRRGPRAGLEGLIDAGMKLFGM